MRLHRIIAAVAAAVLIAGVALIATGDPAGATRPFAATQLMDSHGARLGSVTFAGLRDPSKTLITVKLRGQSGASLNQFHGFHIHANSDPANGTGCVADPAQPSSTWFVSADGHWKLDPAELHGHHAGDLPSVFVNSDGTTEMKVVVSKLTASQVIGRAVVLHAGADNFGNVPVGPGAEQYTPGSGAVARTQATGNAGDRIGCGVVVAA